MHMIQKKYYSAPMTDVLEPKLECSILDASVQLPNSQWQDPEDL